MKVWAGLGLVNVVVLGWVIYGQGQIEDEVEDLSGSCASSYELQKGLEGIEFELRTTLGKPVRSVSPSWFNR